MPGCNCRDRGSSFALIRKDAHFQLVFNRVKACKASKTQKFKTLTCDELNLKERPCGDVILSLQGIATSSVNQGCSKSLGGLQDEYFIM